MLAETGRKKDVSKWRAGIKPEKHKLHGSKGGSGPQQEWHREERVNFLRQKGQCKMQVKLQVAENDVVSLGRLCMF